MYQNAISKAQRIARFAMTLTLRADFLSHQSEALSSQGGSQLSKQMEIGDFTQYIPGVKDLTVPAIVAMFYWLIKRAASPGIHWLTHLLRSSRYRDLKLAKRYRVDPFSIQRQIAKEEALFCAFVVCTVVSLALLVASGGARTAAGRIIFVFQMVPVIALELWWLRQNAFVIVLLEESSRRPRIQASHSQPKAVRVETETTRGAPRSLS